MKVAQSCPTTQFMEFSRPEYFPTQGSDPGSPSPGDLPTTQGSNLGLPHCGRILYQLSHEGSPRVLEWVAPLVVEADPGIKLVEQELNRTGLKLDRKSVV